MTEMAETEKRECDAKLFAKMSRAMGRLERLPKRGRNPHFNYDFVTDGDVADAVRQALAAEGVAFFAEMRQVSQVENKTIAHFNYTFADSESGATWACAWSGEAIDKQDKGIAKAATSALKYFLLKNFILSTGDLVEDPDTSADEPHPNTPERARAPGPPQAIQGDAKPKPDILKNQTEFFATALVAMPYYNHLQHVKNTLKLLGYTGFKASQADEMMAALQAHANEKANEEAYEEAYEEANNDD